MIKKIKNSFYNLSTVFISIIIVLLFIEIFLNIKNRIILDYDIEMWKYAKKLKEPHNNKKINHIHKKTLLLFYRIPKYQLIRMDLEDQILI